MEQTKWTVKKKKGDVFHLDEWNELLQGNGDLFNQFGTGKHGEQVDDSDMCTANMDFEVTVIVKRKTN